MPLRFKYDPSLLDAVDGDLIALLPDQSGSGFDLFQADQAKRPKYTVVDGKSAIKFDGANDFLSCAGVDLSGLTELTVVMACRFFGTATQSILEHGVSPLSTGGIGIYANNSRASLGAGLGNGSTAYRFANCDPVGIVGQPSVLTAIFRPTAAVAADRVNLRLNGIDVTDVLAAAAGSTNAALFKSQTLYMGMRGGASIPASVEVFGVIGADGVLSGVELDDAESWALSLLPPVPAPVSFERTPKNNGESFSEVTYQTEATVIEFDADCTIAGSFPSFAQIGVTVDGVMQAPVALSSGSSTRQVTLPAGMKTVTLSNGPQSRPSGTVLGSWVRAVRANAPLITPEAGGLLIYGDSIAAGDAATPVQNAAWAMVVRDALAEPVSVMAYGYRTLHDDCSTDAGLSAFVAKIADVAPSRIWLAIGTNDCALGKWSAAAFGAAYGKLLDALHAQLPWVTVYAQAPTIRTNHVSSVALFSDQIEVVCASRPWAVYIDGLAILTTADLSDNVHPSTAGHAKYAAEVISIIS